MPGIAIRAEEKVNAGQFVDRDDLMGTCDIQILTDDTLEIIDYKDGMMPVDPEGNLQLSIYAVGAMAPYIKDGEVPFTNLKITIIQPKNVFKGLDPVRTWNAGDANQFLQEFGEILTNHAVATDDPDAPLVPGEDQCRWCDAAGNCEAQSNWAMQQLGLDMGNLSLDAAATDSSEMSDDKLRELVEAAPMIRELLKQAEEESLKRFKAGRNIGGLKVIRGPGRRSWALPEEDMAARLRRMQIPKDYVYKQTLISPAQAEKLTWKKRDGSTKQLSKRQLETLNKEFIKKGDGGLKVVSESVSGDAITFDASNLFAPVVPTVAEQPQILEIPEWMK